jgi:hypothetical protein
MLRHRRWLAGLLVLLFASVEVFASAPELHFHAQIATEQASIPLHGRSLMAQASRSAPADCLACRAFSLATALTSCCALAAPAQDHTLAVFAFAESAASEFADDTRGRAPPAR